MNPESLARYRLQVYNPGSPHPSPQAEPFKSFPATVETDPDNPLKITVRKRRRSSESKVGASPKKKNKMMKKEEVKEFFDGLRKENKEDLEEMKKENAKVFSEFRDSLTTINTQFNSIQS